MPLRLSTDLLLIYSVSQKYATAERAHKGTVYYFAPDSCQWERMEFGYSQFIAWCLQGDVTMYYESLRWPGWEDEVAALNGDQALFIFPFLSTKGPPLEQRHRGVVPIAEMFSLHISGNAAT